MLPDPDEARTRADFERFSDKYENRRTEWRMTQSDVNPSPNLKFPDHQGKYREISQ